MLPSLPDIEYLNNATEKNKKRNEREANSNNILNSDLPSFSLPTTTYSTNYPNGIYDINTDVRIQKRKRGRPSTKVTKPSSRKVNRSLNKQTVMRFIDDLKEGAKIDILCTKYCISRSTGYKLRSDFNKLHDYPVRAARGGSKNRKITLEDSEYFYELLTSNPQITSPEIKEKLKERNGKDVSASAINKHLSAQMSKFGLLNFTIKKCVFVENRRNSEDILEKRIKYINIYRECLIQ